MPISPQPTARRQHYRDGVPTHQALAMANSPFAADASPTSTNISNAARLAQQPPQSPCSNPASKIPRQVHGTATKMPIEGPKLQNRYYQQRNESSSITVIENGTNVASNRYHKSNKSAANSNTTDYNKYLTFNKDQATSHFNALKEELGAQVSPPVSPRTAANVAEAGGGGAGAGTGQIGYPTRLFEVSKALLKANQASSDEPDSPSSSSITTTPKHQCTPPTSQRKLPSSPDTTASESVTTSSNLLHPSDVTTTTSPIARPRLSKQKQQQTPIQLSNNNINKQQQRDDSRSKLAANYDNNNELVDGDKSSSTATTKNSSAFLHQPTCEAFIMTGQSMLKLSCNESELRDSGRRLLDTRGAKQQLSNTKTNFSNNIIQTSTSSGQIDSTNSSEHINLSVATGADRRLPFGLSGDQLEAAPKLSDIGRLEQLEREQQLQQQQRSKSQSFERLDSSCRRRRRPAEVEVSAEAKSGLCPSAGGNSSGPKQAAQEATKTTAAELANFGDKEEQRAAAARDTQEQHERAESVADRRRRQWTATATTTTTTTTTTEGGDDDAAGAQFQSTAASDPQRPTFIAPPAGQPALLANAACQRTKRDEMMDISRRRNLDQQPLVIRDHQQLEANNDKEDGWQFVGAREQPNPKQQQQQQQQQQQHTHIMATTTELENGPMVQATKDFNDQQHQQPSCNERESARRLAKRLYNLSGFKKSDVCHHLSKSNPFSQMVAEEYLNLFDFRTMKLDAALRKFLSKLHLNGETQERERMLGQFSKRYYDCNKEKFPNADTVQTLVCALILLNTDLHTSHLDRGRGKNKRNKLSLGAFIDGLNSSLASLPPTTTTTTPLPLTAGVGLESTNITPIDLLSSSSPPGASNLNKHPSAYTFPRHLLVDLYESIKKRPIKYVEDKCDMTSFEAELDRIYGHHQSANSRSNTLPTRRFAPGSNAPSSTMSARSRRQLRQGLNKMNGVGINMDDLEFDSIEFKSGFLHRKRVFEAHGKPTPKGRRGWRQAYFILQDLRLIMRYEHQPSKNSDDGGGHRGGGGAANSPSAGGVNKNSSPKAKAKLLAQDLKNLVRIYHSFAKRSTSYTKRDHVFHLQLADQSEFLIQASSEQDMLVWIDTINFASACLSSPALPSAISNGRRSQQQRQRPILPASYTKLSYWEQLIDHEERLQRLKVELEDHLNEAPNTKNASKRFQTEFIEKIAYLKYEIERYKVYVDLMRKKSNSPEAIILSKHPQIASLKPSDEMIKSLPSFAPPKLVESNRSSDGQEAELRDESVQ